MSYTNTCIFFITHTLYNIFWSSLWSVCQYVIEVLTFRFSWNLQKLFRNLGHFYTKSLIFRGSKVIGQFTDRQFHDQVGTVHLIFHQRWSGHLTNWLQFEVDFSSSVYCHYNFKSHPPKKCQHSWGRLSLGYKITK